MQTRLLLGAALIAAQFVTVPALAKRSASVREPFTLLEFAPTDGRVGYRIGARLAIRFDDVPSGNTGGPTSGSCRSLSHYISYSGDLPPGIEEHLELGGRDRFSGTPRQPGRWTITVELEIECQGGPDLTRYQRSVHVTFNIEP